MILLTFRDLMYRHTRFIVVSVLAAVVFALLFVMTGLVEQFNLEPYDTIDAIDAETWVIPDGVKGPFTAGPAMPISIVDELNADTKNPGVTARSSLSEIGGADEEVIVIGHEIGGLGTPTPQNGRPAEVPGELVADTSLGLDLGVTVTLGGEDFTVVGTNTNTTLLAGIPVVFMPLADAQNLIFRTTEVISVVFVEGEISSLPPGTKTMTSNAVAADVLEPLEGAIASVDLVRGLLWIVAAIIIGAVVYLSALDRQRDFAVLKAIGAPNSALLGSLAMQAVLVALLSVGLAAIVQIFLAPVFPLRVRVPTRAFWQVPLFAVVVSLVAGAAGMRRVVRADPSQAFAGGS